MECDPGWDQSPQRAAFALPELKGVEMGEKRR